MQDLDAKWLARGGEDVAKVERDDRVRVIGGHRNGEDGAVSRVVGHPGLRRGDRGFGDLVIFEGASHRVERRDHVERRAAAGHGAVAGWINRGRETWSMSVASCEVSSFSSGTSVTYRPRAHASQQPQPPRGRRPTERSRSGGLLAGSDALPAVGVLVDVGRSQRDRVGS